VRPLAAATLLLSALVPAPVFSQAAAGKTPAVTVVGEAIVSAEPDRAEIDLGVVTQAKSAAQAAAENAEKLSRVVAEIEKMLGQSDEIETVGYSLVPNYRQPSPREPGRVEIVGYTATNVLRVRTDLVRSLGPLIDAATRAGANRVQRLAFGLKDEQAAQRRALREATLRARAKADEVAAALGLKVARILSVDENAREVRPFVADAGVARAEALAAPTPIEGGTVQLRASVTLTAEIAPAAK
jgi:uncharacterized protein YggE